MSMKIPAECMSGFTVPTGLRCFHRVFPGSRELFWLSSTSRQSCKCAFRRRIPWFDVDSISMLFMIEQSVNYLQHYYFSHVTRKPVFGNLRPGKTQTGLHSHRSYVEIRQRTTKALIRLRGWAGWSAPLLFAYCINRFPRDVAHLQVTDRLKAWALSSF